MLDSAASSISMAALSASTVPSSRYCCSRSYFSLRAANFRRLEYRNLVGQLRVARILEADLTVPLGDLLHQLRGERAQLVGVKGIQVDRGVHPGECARNTCHPAASRSTGVGRSDRTDRVVGGEAPPREAPDECVPFFGVQSYGRITLRIGLHEAPLV